MKEYGSRLHRILEILSWIILGLSFLVAVYGMFTLPDVIATHYNVRGEVDDYGSPATLFMTPVCMGICLLIVSLCMHFVNPRNWNTVTEVRRRNRESGLQGFTDHDGTDRIGSVCFYLLPADPVLPGDRKRTLDRYADFLRADCADRLFCFL